MERERERERERCDERLLIENNLFSNQCLTDVFQPPFIRKLNYVEKAKLKSKYRRIGGSSRYLSAASRYNLGMDN